MLKSFSSAPQITDKQLNEKRQQLRPTLQNDVVQVCGFLTSDLQVLAHFSPLKELELHLEPFVLIFSSPLSNAMAWALSFYQNAYSEFINNCCIVMNSEYVFEKISASHFFVVLQIPRQLVEFKEGSASGSVFLQFYLIL